MLIFENFITALLTREKITNYSSNIKSTRQFYNEIYIHVAGCNFNDFLSRLWHHWYVRHFTRKNIIFDEKWINYLQVKLTENPTHLFNETECKVCLEKFPNNGASQTHLLDEKHSIRMEYLRNSKVFTKHDDLNLKILECNNVVDGFGTTLKIKMASKTNTNITLLLKNEKTIALNVIDVFQINLLSDLTLHVQSRKCCSKKTESILVVLNGYFEHSTSFVFPIGIIAQDVKSCDRIYTFKEIEFEIVSDYSNLWSGEEYKERTHVPNDFTNEIVIPGEIPPSISSSNYEEKIILKRYNIPASLQDHFTDISKRYPSFINRIITGKNAHFHNECAKELAVDEKLTTKNYCDRLNTMINVEENQLKIDVRNYDTMATLKRVKGNVFMLDVPGLAEARPSLLVGDAVYAKESSKHGCKFQGIVHKVLETAVHLGFNKRFTNVFANNKKFHIEFGYNRRSLRVTRQAIELVKKHQIVSYFFPQKLNSNNSQENSSNCELNFFNKSLNDEQKRAVENVLKPRQQPYLIFGPPGTGKTVTVVESVLQTWRTIPQSKILVCAPSNATVNEIALRLLHKIPSTEMLRLFCKSHSKDADVERLKSISNLRHDSDFYLPPIDVILKYRVLMTTLVTAARLVNGGVAQGVYTHVFIDESGYATESETLIPIAGILSGTQRKKHVAGHVVLAGDPRQLGPVIHSNFAKYCGYGTSMLERLVDTCEIYTRNDSLQFSYDPRYITKLLKNYRSHEAILKIPNELFYHNELQVASDKQITGLFEDSTLLKTPNFPIIFHHVTGEDKREKDSPSFFNIQEIEEIMTYLSKLLSSRVRGTEITEEHIGIITPYRKQVELIRKACVKHHWTKLAIGSVEQFQGKEKLIVIMSTVRSKNSNKFEEIDRVCQIGFVRNPKRFNVALTRAKALLVVVGNGEVLQQDERWRRFLRYCSENKSVAGKTFSLDTKTN